MAVACGTSFGICALRVTKLDDLGNVSTDSPNSYTTSKVISMGVTPDIETGNTFSLRNGCGCSISRFKALDIFNWWTFAFADGALEPQMMALMLGATVITNGADVVGLHFPGAFACDDIEPAVAMEFWTKHLVDSDKDPTYPFIHWVFPKTVWQLGDNTAEEDYMRTALTGFSRSNPLWGSGPYGDGPPDGSDVAPDGSYWKTATTLPTDSCVGTDVAPGS
jgi:hypothetical protein